MLRLGHSTCLQQPEQPAAHAVRGLRLAAHRESKHKPHLAVPGAVGVVALPGEAVVAAPLAGGRLHGLPQVLQQLRVPAGALVLAEVHHLQPAMAGLCPKCWRLRAEVGQSM